MTTALRRCPQHWRYVPATEFVSDKPGAMCSACRGLYGSGGRRTTAERRGRIVGATEALPRVTVVELSKNRKLGNIACTLSSSETCPDACSLKGNGCYAEFHVLGYHWGRTASHGMSWAEFLVWAKALPDGKLWRHNVAGDLAGRGDALDVKALRDLATASRWTCGFTFTHKPLRRRVERQAVYDANQAGFVVNLSADSPAHADRLRRLECAPVAAIVPPGTRTGDRTPGGHRIVVCPAQTDARLSCSTCALCANAGRKGIVGFLPHGQMSASIVKRLPLLKQEVP